MEHGRASIEIWFMMTQWELDRTSALPRVFLESLRQSSEILGHLRKFRIFSENVRERSSGLRNNFGKFSEIFGK